MHRAIGHETPMMTANRMVECIGSLLRYAAMCGPVERGHNPAADIKQFREQRRERFLTSEELGRVGEALNEAGDHWYPVKASPWRTDFQTRLKTSANHLGPLPGCRGLRPRSDPNKPWHAIVARRN
jgi:hypothetical protein